MKKLIFSLIFLLCVGYTFAAPDCPIREVDGKAYYEYTVVQGDGIYSIARSFGVNQSEIYNANPDLTPSIKPGQIILIPAPREVLSSSADAVEVKNAEVKYHIVEPKQTLFGISRQYNITIDSITRLNPFVAQGIHPGDTVFLVPRQVLKTEEIAKTTETEAKVKTKAQVEKIEPQKVVSRFHIVQRKETLFGISRQYSMAIHDIIALNPEVESRLRTGDTLWLEPIVTEPIAEERPSVTILPAIPEQPTNNRDIRSEELPIAEVDTIADTPAFPFQEPTIIEAPSSAIRIVFLLPFQTDQTTVHKSTLRFVEFYRGALVALENAKRHGVSAIVNTFDTGRTAADIASLLSRPELQEADVIIGPAYTDQLRPVISFARDNNIAAVIPFSSNVPDDLHYAGLFQFNPSYSYTNTQAVKAIAEDKSQRYVIGRFANVEEENKSLADILHTQLNTEGISHIDTTLNFATLRHIVNTVGDHPTTILMASSAPADVNMMLDTLASYQRHNIRVWGSEKWASLTTKYPNTVYSSLFNVQETKEYTDLYNELFGTHSILTEPRYDLLGYDLTTMAARALKKMNDSTFVVDPLPTNEYMQSAPLFIPYHNRMVNNRLTIYHWDGTTLNSTDHIALPAKFDDDEE